MENKWHWIDGDESYIWENDGERSYIPRILIDPDGREAFRVEKGQLSRAGEELIVDKFNALDYIQSNIEQVAAYKGSAEDDWQ